MAGCRRGRGLNLGTVVAIMVVIVAIGLLVNQALFASIESRLHRRWDAA